ncbi:hypothetical protein Tco_0594760 [Tanacetum coccineum]
MQKRSETETKSSRRGHTKGVKKTQTVKVIPLKEKEAVKAHTKSRTKRYAKSVGRRRIAETCDEQGVQRLSQVNYDGETKGTRSSEARGIATGNKHRDRKKTQRSRRKRSYHEEEHVGEGSMSQLSKKVDVGGHTATKEGRYAEPRKCRDAVNVTQDTGSHVRAGRG